MQALNITLPDTLANALNSYINDQENVLPANDIIENAESNIQNQEPVEIKSYFRQEPEFEIVSPIVHPEPKMPVYVETPVDKQNFEQEDQRQVDGNDSEQDDRAQASSSWWGRPGVW